MRPRMVAVPGARSKKPVVSGEDDGGVEDSATASTTRTGRAAQSCSAAPIPLDAPVTSETVPSSAVVALI